VTEEEHNSRQEAIFDEHADFFASEDASPPQVLERLRRIAVTCQVTPETTILDVATGTGGLLPHFEDRGANLRLVTGVDLSGGMLDYARKRFPSATFVKSDIMKYRPVAGARFDRVVFNACFGNFWDQGLVLKHTEAELVRDGGLIVISHPLGRKWLGDLKARDPQMVRHALPTRVELEALASRCAPGLAVELCDDEADYYCAALRCRQQP